jgi:hypothetical protein
MRRTAAVYPGTIRCSPAMAAKVTDTPMDTAEMVNS